MEKRQNQTTHVFCVVTLLLGITTGVQAVTLTDHERDIIHHVSSNINSTSQFIAQVFSELVEKTYKKSYRDFIDKFDEVLDNFEQTVLRALEEQLRQPDQTSTFYQVNKEVYEIMADAFKDIQKARTTFDSYRGKPRDAETARNCLKSVEPHLRALILSNAFASIEDRLKKVYTMLEQADEQNLIEEIRSIEVSLRNLEKHPSFKSLSQSGLKLRLANIFTRMFERGT